MEPVAVESTVEYLSVLVSSDSVLISDVEDLDISAKLEASPAARLKNVIKTYGGKSSEAAKSRRTCFTSR